MPHTRTRRHTNTHTHTHSVCLRLSVCLSHTHSLSHPNCLHSTNWPTFSCLSRLQHKNTSIFRQFEDNSLKILWDTPSCRLKLTCLSPACSVRPRRSVCWQRWGFPAVFSLATGLLWLLVQAAENKPRQRSSQSRQVLVKCVRHRCVPFKTLTGPQSSRLDRIADPGGLGVVSPCDQ